MTVGGSTCGLKTGGNFEEAKSLGGAKKRAPKKRPLTPYNKFVKAQYPKMKAKFTTLSAPQIMKKIAAEWQKQKM
jgi:hypothetical protein